MNRRELQALSDERVRDAQALLNARQWSAAYYLVGYAVECALKSCVLHHIEKTGELFSEREYLKQLSKCWTHDLTALIQLARLEKDLGQAQAVNPALGRNWATVQNWNETARYARLTEIDARGLVDAITHDPDGVLSWIRNYW
jgi:hypothetical protein